MRRAAIVTGLVTGLMVALSGCRPLTPIVSAGAPASVVRAPSPSGTAAGASTAAVVPPSGSPRPSASVIPPTTTPDEVVRTAMAVFGESPAAVLEGNGAGAPAAVGGPEPVWDIEVRSFETHARVTRYVQLFTSSSRDYFTTRLRRGTRYDAMIRTKLRAAGMPEDLTYLALVESGYDPNAYSRAAAVGLWQFMSGTARTVGLRVDWWMDERRDPVRSTDAAIRMLAYLQRQFGSLYLAAAAYNGGEGRVTRGLTRHATALAGTEGEERFFVLADQGYLRNETVNYVPQLIAAALVGKVPARFGIVIDSLPPFSYDSVRAGPGTSLAAVAAVVGATPAVMAEFNPALLRGIVPPDSSHWVRVPSGSAMQVQAVLDSMPPDDRVGYRMVPVTKRAGTIAALAAAEGISAKQLAWFNPRLKTTRSGRLPSGTMVRVPKREVLAFVRVVPDPAIERYGPAPRRSTTKSAAAKKSSAKTSAAKKTSAKKSPAKKTSAKTSSAKKPSAKKASAKPSAVKQGAAKPSSGKKTSAKTSSGKKPTGKTSTGKKPTGKTSTGR
ncbi:MAG: transglycosylase SLT domain-containing protein [Gemmatimonadaceae bacterium]